MLISVDAVCGEPQFAQFIIQQHPRAGAALAVHVAHIFACKVRQAGNAQWIAGRHQQALLAFYQRDQLHRQLRQIAAHGSMVESATVGVDEMAAGKMAFAARQRNQPAKAAHIGGAQAQPGRALRQELR